jgi:hypothetical protein
MLDHLHATTFRAQLHTLFSIHLPSRHAVAVELVEVTAAASTAGKRPGAACRSERFSLLFRGPHEAQLPQGMYEMRHGHLGTFGLLLVPIGRDRDGVYYEAVFNRLRRRDG